MKVLVNVTASPVEIPDTGVTVPADSRYTLTPQDYALWSYSRDVITAIVAGSLVVNDGEDNLIMRYGIALIQGNQTVLDEHYTLVQEDDILIGNGQILYLNDVFETTDNVPGYIDEILEDDADVG